jgi:hypothetical protein
VRDAQRISIFNLIPSSSPVASSAKILSDVAAVRKGLFKNIFCASVHEN